MNADGFLALIPLVILGFFIYGFWNLCMYRSPFPLVRRSEYEKVKTDLEAWKIEYQILQLKWNNLCDTVNKKGGADFLRRGTIPRSGSTGSSTLPNKMRFTPSEIKLMVKYCHPDKAGNSPEIHELTLKLISLMKKTK